MSRNFQLCGSVNPYYGRSQSSPKPTVDIAEPSSSNDREVDCHTPSTSSLSEELRHAAALRDWQIADKDSRFEIVVPIGLERKQRVTVDFEQSDEQGRQWIVCSSCCGPASKKNAMTLLRLNARLRHMAFAIRKSDGEELTILRGSRLAAGASVTDVIELVESVAQYADRAEAKLISSDEY